MRGIRKGFPGVQALDGVDLKLHEGEVLALLGENGAGKSTLIKVIGGAHLPDEGTMEIEGHSDPIDTPQDSLKAGIGIIYQENNLLPDFTALENVYLANLSITNNKDLALSKAVNLLKKVGLSNRLDHFPSQLSGGESQRVAISRAIINDPEIILADEPTGSLDFNTAKDIFELLNNQTQSNRLIIFATHNRYFANKADYLLEMIDGSIKPTYV